MVLLRYFSIFPCVLLHAHVLAAEIPSTSGSTIQDLHARSLLLLSKYNLNPINKTRLYDEPEPNAPLPLENSFILDTADSESGKAGNQKKIGFIFLQEASRRVGLDPALYIGKRLVRLNYVLQDSTQANTSITANILFCDTNMAGAYLVLDGYAPGIVSINDRSQFKPKNFIFPILNPDLLDTVSILGPWDRSDKGCGWINRVKYLSIEEASYLAGIFSAGKKVQKRLKYRARDPVEEYGVLLNFKTGEQYFPHCIFRNDTAYLNDYKCYYVLDRKFIDFVKGAIKSRGIPLCKESPVKKQEK